MTKRKYNLALDEGSRAVKRKVVPHEFVLEALASLSPETRRLFSCLAVYVQGNIVLALRDKRDETADDDGVWLPTTVEHHESLQRDFPCMRSIRVLGKKVTGWQLLPADASDFEEAALRACEFVVAGDPRIGKRPPSRGAPGSKIAAAKRKSRAK
jgi:hypothetical protein